MKKMIVGVLFALVLGSVLSMSVWAEPIDTDSGFDNIIWGT